jgi:hypothetical protein
MKRTASAIILIFIAVGSIASQSSKSVDISAIAAAGRVSDDKYSNPVLSIEVVAPNATLQANPLVDKEGGGRARLLQVLSKQAGSDDTYTFAVLVDTLATYPQLQSPAHYVRSVRHQLEKNGFATVRGEFPITVGGLQFTGAIVRQHAPNSREHCRGLYTTFRNGLIISFDAEATTEEKLNQLVKRLVNFGQ